MDEVLEDRKRCNAVLIFKKGEKDEWRNYSWVNLTKTPENKTGISNYTICNNKKAQTGCQVRWKTDLWKRTRGSWWKRRWMWVSSALGAKKVNPVLCCTSKTASSSHREVILPLFGTCESTAGAPPSLGLPSTRKTWMYWSEPIEGLPGWLEGWCTGYMRRGWGTWVCSAWRRRRLEMLVY